MLVENQMVEVKWNGATRKHFEEKGYVFTKAGEKFIVPIKHLNKGSNISVLAICDGCESKFSRPMQRLNRKNQTRHFCSNECQTNHAAKEKLARKPSKNCKNCNIEYKFAEYRKDTTNFCSVSCLSEWQSKNTSGENSHFYVERFTVKCDWCDSEVEKTKNKLEQHNFNFCNRECQKNWHREVLVKSENFLEKSRETMLNNLSEGKIKNTETKPHLKINKILENNNIKYKNEEIVFQYALDIYLLESDLFIEINGGYWHCDNRLYKNIQFDHQLARIIKDRRKRTYLSNNLNKNILYLWEQDIIKNPKMCELLIIEFIKNKGSLENYHSMNFSCENSILTLNKELEVPYMDYDLDSLFLCTDKETRERVTGYDESKYTTFNCEYCNIEKTQLLVSYDKASNHFCSVSCNNKFRGQQKQLNKPI